jgi:CRISPR-associated endonuclease Cas3-HD
MEYLAHSRKGEYPAQSYKEHVMNVKENGVKYARDVESYSKMSDGILADVVECAAVWHDIGKLDEENQEVLHEEKEARHLPVNHVDAGAAILMQQEKIYPAMIVYSHHRGLPEIDSEEKRENRIFRDAHSDIREKVDESLEALKKIHQQEIPLSVQYTDRCYEGDRNIFFRMLLSCLADADHMDTAITYGQSIKEENRLDLLRAEERLELLDKYVSKMGNGDERSNLRREMYFECRDSIQTEGFSICDSPVGSGKTTAVMAHLLKQASIRKSRRIFVILPYTSIITQSVEVYRKALVFPDENPEEIVAELHCRADFEDKDSRYLNALWRAPVVVTTAVAFFETLSSNRPAALRRLHELPGSVIFLDEAHAALPMNLLPLAWHWMNVLADEWSCYWVLSSGSLVRFWQLESLEKLKMEKPKISNLVSESLHKRLMEYEKNRISFKICEEPLGMEELVHWVQKMPGPRLLILNTIQSAAVIADEIRCLYGRKKVEHLSTALKADDRAATIQNIRKRLDDKSDDDWTLVATSCVEAGVDFSFRTGFREVSSFVSLIQSSGRVNRQGEFQGAEMWSFSMQDVTMKEKNTSLDTSRAVLLDYFMNQIAITPELSTQSMNDEIKKDDSCLKTMEDFITWESEMGFETIEKKFKVIDDTDIVTAVVDKTLASNIYFGGGDWMQLQQCAVSIRRNKIGEWRLKNITKNIYQWTLPYDSFLGYMAGVLEVEKAKNETLLI